MSLPTNSIINFVGKLITSVNNLEARQALFDSYNDTRNSLITIQNFFIDFTSQQWSKKAIRIFFRNWRSPGFGAASFCALSFRLLKLADQTSNLEIKNLLYRCATRISEISHEDVGIGTMNHQELYEKFALKISGDDEWKLDKYFISGIKDFLSDSRLYRQNGDDLSYAIMLSLPEELYNYGEFSFIGSLFIQWHRDILKMSSENRKSDLHFIYDHLGTTESRHFSSIVQAFEDYCILANIKPDWVLLYQFNKNFIEKMAIYFENLMSAMLGERTTKSVDKQHIISSPFTAAVIPA